MNYFFPKKTENNVQIAKRYYHLTQDLQNEKTQ